DLAVGIRVLQQRTKYLLPGQLVQRAHQQLEAERGGTGLHHGERLRMTVLLDEEAVAPALGDASGQRHGLGSGGSLVEQRSVGQVQTSEVDGQLLEIQQRLQASLGNFR